MKSINKIITIAAATLSMVACSKKLDVAPSDSISASSVYTSKAGYKSVLGKVYAAMATTGSTGPGSSDVGGIDAGFSDFFRLYWKAQELPTDEAVIAWGDAGIQDFHLMNWSSQNPFLKGLYYRCLYQISVANEFLRRSTAEQLASNGIPASDTAEINEYRHEARFLRAYQFSVLMDLFGNPPFPSDTEPLGTTPKQISRKALFKFIEAELKDIEPKILAARTNEYGRADRGAVQALLARNYLNAQVYTDSARYVDAATYAQKVIDAGYTLKTDYTQLMLADNNLNATESIFTINYDGVNTQTYGGTTFLVHAAVGGKMLPTDFGIGGGWYGIRTTANIVNLYKPLQFNSDNRKAFFTNGQNEEIKDLATFTDGYAITKYKNITSSGAAGKDNTFVDIDMPVFRLAEMYLIYAEANISNSNAGNSTNARRYLELLRERAYGNSSSNGDVQLTLAYILDERAKELFWEGFRRTDLIRHDKFTNSSYLWPWKGGSKDGVGVDSYRKLYPIPLADLAANPNMKQNDKY